MKTANVITAAVMAISGVSSSALAATGAREDNSDVVVWIFLAFCALIVIGQLFPLVKNFKAVKPRPETTDAKERL